MTGERQLRTQLAHLLDADLLRVLDEPQRQNVGVLPGEDASATGADAARSLLCLSAQNELRSPQSEPVPASAGGFMDQQRVRHSIGGVGGRERCRFRTEPARGHAEPTSASSATPACLSTSASGLEASITRTRAGSRRAICR